MQAPDHAVQAIVNKVVNRFDFDAPERLTAYLVDVLAWNQTIGLVSRKDPLAACERLLLESMELVRVLGLERGRVADIGSGAGFPGIPWALNNPLLEVTMIERREKRALFLERVCRTLAIENATAVAMDARAAADRSDFQCRFDLIVTMAVGDPSSLATIVEPMLEANGRFASTTPTAVKTPGQIGTQLVLERRVDGEFGCYAIYRRGV
jgi:16S rRNA (guanine527-N7)-methyltransferase